MYFDDMTRNRVNNAIKHLGLEIQRNSGYYFTDLERGHQVGGYVDVSCLKELALIEWVDEAEAARLED